MKRHVKILLLRLQYAFYDIAVKIFPDLRGTFVISAIEDFSVPSSVTLVAPLNHRLIFVRTISPLYDILMPIAATLIGRHYPDEAIIDVGANVGDSTAIFRLNGCQNRIHAFEPSSVFWAYMELNMMRSPALFKDVTLHRAFVGERNLDMLKLIQAGSTASVKLGPPDSTKADASEINIMQLSDCGASACAFVKLDTDGYDFSILQNEIPFLKTFLPAIWFEAEIKGDANAETDKLMMVLESLKPQYDSIFLFDNFGMPFFSAHLGDVNSDQLRQILQYTFYNSFAHRTIYYFDILLIPLRMAHLVTEFKSQIRKVAFHADVDVAR